MRRLFVLLALVVRAVPSRGSERRAATAPATQPARQVSGVFDLGHAPSVVFVCSSSGSMMTKWDSVRAAMREVVGAMHAGQVFNVVFMTEDRCLPLAKELVDPSGANQERLVRLFDRASGHGGSDDPLPAIKFAMELKPAVIFLMTDGDFPNNNEVVELIRKLNVEKKVRVNTIALIDHDESYEEFLKQVAKENGGTFLFADDEAFGVGESELDRSVGRANAPVKR